MKIGEIRPFEIYPFISRLFEDLEATLPALGCGFRGIVTPMDILAKGDVNALKNGLFLVFYDLAQVEKSLTVKFSLSGTGLELRLCFLFQTETLLKGKLETLEHWEPDFFKLMDSSVEDGFFIPLEAGPEQDGTLPWDEAQMKEFYAGDPGGEMLIKAFPTRAQELIQNLRNALDNKDVPEAMRASHSLKGAARGIFAMPLSHRSHLMEMATRANDLTRSEELFAQIIEAYEALKNYWEQKEKH